MHRTLAMLPWLVLSTVSSAWAGALDDYGTREPASCRDRSSPLTSETAALYFACDIEGEWSGHMYLVSDVSIRVSSKPRQFNPLTDSFPSADPSQPVYDIRGSFRRWQCSAKGSLSWTNSPGAACNYGDQPNAQGLCYLDTFSDWHCTMRDPINSALTVKNVPPPQD